MWVLSGHSVLTSPSQQWSSTSKDFYPICYPLHCVCYPYSCNSASISLLLLSAKQGTYLHHSKTSLVSRSPWLRVEPDTSRTRSKHSTTRLSRRRNLYDYANRVMLVRRYKLIAHFDSRWFSIFQLEFAGKETKSKAWDNWKVFSDAENWGPQNGPCMIWIERLSVTRYCHEYLWDTRQ